MNSPNMTPEMIQAERKAKRFWVSFIVFFLGLQVVIGMASLRLATGDSSVAIVPNYHTTALNWDSHQLKATAAKRLGLKLTMIPSDVVDASGNRAIEVRVEDKQGQPVSSLQIGAKIYHHSNANQVDSVTFRATESGRYLALAPMGRPGVWQVELKVDGADEPILQSLRVDL